MWAAEEVGVRYDRIDLGGPFGGLDKPDYLARNPNKRIPTIDDDGFILWESNAIVRYLGHKYANDSLWPREPKLRGLAEQWMDWQQTTLFADFVVLIVQLLRTPAEKRDMGAVETARQKVEANWAIFDSHLAKNAFAAGDHFTLGDVPLGVFAWRRYELPIQRTNLANLDTWYKRLQQRPAYKKTVMTPLS
jgi:glutathione S-transferase